MDYEDACHILVEWRELAEVAERRDGELAGVKARFRETTRQEVRRAADRARGVLGPWRPHLVLLRVHARRTATAHRACDWSTRLLRRHPRQVLAFAGEGRALADRLKASGPGAPGTPLPGGLELLAAFQKVGGRVQRCHAHAQLC